jgi:hypothetical protein
VGTAIFGVDGHSLDQLLVTADQAMYRTKSMHKLRKLTASRNVDSVIDFDNDELTTASVN